MHLSRSHNKDLHYFEGQQFNLGSAPRDMIDIQSQTPTKLKRKVTSNPRGLSLWYDPPKPYVDFVFVHGLKGGSYKTWCKDEDLDLLWPKEWISQEPGLGDIARTWTFGYANNWTELKASKLTLHDSRRDLLYQLENTPLLRTDKKAPIVLIGHSMGGLVIKKAYLIAREQSKAIADRIRHMVFLATPHRGSSSADLLKSFLDVTRQDKAYVEELIEDSGSLQVINDAFRVAEISERLQLWSFYETRGTVSSNLVVRRDSAVLGSGTEETNMLYANHREVCKFDSRDDVNYITLRNTFLAIVESPGIVREQNDIEDLLCMESVRTYLNVVENPEGDLERQLEDQVQGSCSWIEKRVAFRNWESGGSVQRLQKRPLPSIGRGSALCVTRNPRIYWLGAKPGAGKSTSFQGGSLATADAGGCIIVRRLVLEDGKLDRGTVLMSLQIPLPVRQLVLGPDIARLLVATSSLDSVGFAKLQIDSRDFPSVDRDTS